MKTKSDKITWAIDEYILESISCIGDLPEAVESSGHNLFRTKYVPLSDEQNYPDYDPEVPVLLYGTIGYISRCKIPFMPGAYAFGNETDANIVMSSILYEYMLNSNYIMMPFGQVAKRHKFIFDLFGDNIFIRPNSGKKSFTGTTFNSYNFDHELYSIKELQHVTDEEICLIAPAFPLKAEYRLVVADHEIIGYSQYRRDDVLDVRCDISNDALKLAEKIARMSKQPDLIYTLDIAELPDGKCRVIELNSFNSSGLYAIDRERVVAGINKAVLKDFNGM